MESRSAESTRKKLLVKGLSPNFCLVPFTTLTIEPDGHLGCCRQKGSQFSIGNLHTQSLAEAWNGDPLRRWRREFLEGSPQTCRSEIRHSSCNLCPDYNSLLDAIDPREIQPGPPLRLGLNLNGKCNLRCRMCVVWKQPNGIFDRLDLQSSLEPHIKTLREVELHSGEPFIQKDTYRLISWISDHNPECLWTITTNAHWRLSGRIEEHLDKIRFKNLIISIDSLDAATYAKIRQGGRLGTVMKNVNLLRDYNSRRVARGQGTMNIRANFLIQQDNWSELPQIFDFERKTGIDCFRTFLYEPRRFSLLDLPSSEREAILTFYETALSPQQIRGSFRILLPLIDSLPRIDQVLHWERMQQSLKGN
ncbi:MAG: hypothetical protein A2X94_08025 [Bdellovibrionales bacterium GWB1_55_8]|nr:MAG: hypothetical protein A2X94_08025 [Bdellovibrionales bacterium GWB1_55_8]